MFVCVNAFTHSQCCCYCCCQCCYHSRTDTGQVCLSLLGTWDGPGWESGTSNIYQLLSTILYMILGAKHPYYMEPDYGD